jgi:plasmid maintenance system antidote protein VapI
MPKQKPSNPTLVLQREADKVTRAVLAARLGVSEPYLNEMILGRRSLTAPVLRKLGLRAVWVTQ